MVAFLRTVLLIFVPPLALLIVSGIVIGIQYAWHGPNWFTDFAGMAGGSYAAIHLAKEVAKSAKMGWALYAFLFCLLYSGLCWFVVLQVGDASQLPLAVGSLVGAIVGLTLVLQELREEPSTDV
ncbi:hypothetical protein EF888_19995 [Silicimonas algicola]|uniref:Uncharacterized protein n=1 Tax=Silicimonas algicola TaxID=1826607 RepID=A0A316G2T9_9RHOB|nr:hypothetical protein [Silicimonas algicola]AZQ69214.1 hypothetical protein EF888_19995 [Silicimonas algicola]PWK54972.1 hypothetical protein C8D95_10959 [Silicimonas algicola]